MKKVVALFVVLGLLVLLAGGAALFYLGPIVKAGVERVGPRIAKVPVKLDGANISVFSGNGQLKGFFLGNPEGFKTPEAVKVGVVAISLAPKSVLDKKVVVRSIRIEAPEITYEAGLGGSNIGKILENLQSVASQEKTGATNTSSKALQVDEFVITGGKINVSATMLGGRSATLPLPEIRLAGLGQGPEGITPAELFSKAFGEVVQAAAKAVTASAANLGKSAVEAAEGLTSGAADRVKKLGSGVSDLFKSKKE
jgi:uncharacterized protein involved in outer membrane biogenesis